MLTLAHRVEQVKPSATLAVAAKADALIAAGKDIISLSLGEPDFDTPDFIKEAAIKAIKDGFTKYTAIDGIPGLKKAIINKFKKDNHLTYENAQILVSCGAKHSIYNLLQAVLNPGDEVIIPAPFWVSYPDMVRLADAVPVIVSTDFSEKFKMTAEKLAAAITPKTRLLILNSPSNPTGVAYSKSELKALGEVLAKYPNIIIMSDDIYEHTLWSAEPFSNILMACPEFYERCVIVNGVSKAYAMTGWRIGYAAGNAKIIGAMKKIQSQSTSNPCSIAQVAAEAALQGDQSCTAIMTKAYKNRHDYIVDELRKLPGVKCLAGDGTFYCFPLIDALIQKTGMKNDIEFSEFLLNQAGIAVIPGSAFGAPNYIRISYATSMDKLREAMERLKKALA